MPGRSHRSRLVSLAPAAVALLGGAIALLPSCGSTATSACTPGGDGTYVDAPYDDLAKYCVVRLENGRIQPTNERVLPYEVNDPLFSDHATKVRTLWVPPGTSVTYKADGVFDFPVGTILSKSFGFPVDPRDPGGKIRFVETRILARGDKGWKAVSYVWDDAQTTATIKPGGAVRAIDVVPFVNGAATETEQASYLVPSQNQCPKCHERDGFVQPIGPRAADLNRDFLYGSEPAADKSLPNQLARWSARGTLKDAPAPDAAPRFPVWSDAASGDVATRARAYLEGNCAYCHNAGGEARTTGLFLGFAETDPLRFGVCKPPVAAGRATSNLDFDVVPGDPDRSILVRRMESVEPSIAMPELGRSLVHKDAVALVRAWVSGLPGTCAPP
ncbi:MAG: hypothetical protein JWM74_2143 [Myxococcaceae bacterium]|nr:hypothetical protein [Myxococcaceae bacterium]